MDPSAASIFRDRNAERLSGLVDGIYDAGVNPARWPEAVAAIARSMDASRALLFTPYLAPQHGGVIFPHEFPELALQLWATTYIEQDLWAINSAKKGLFRTGLVVLDDDMVDRREFLASAFYRDFLSRFDIGRVCAGVVFEGSPDLPGMVLSMFRADSDRAFTRDDVMWLSMLVPHVSRAMGIMQRLDTARVHAASLLASFDRLRFGVALLNAGMQVLHLNQAAQTVLNRGDGLALDANRRLDNSQPAKDARSLSRWLQHVKDAPATEQAHFLDGCTVAREPAREPAGAREARRYSVQCAPVPAAASWRAADEAVRYVVFITDPSNISLPGAERLHRVYGLTARQARLAREFSWGGSYKQVAKRLRVSEETVRSHIKQIYPKMRVNRRSDLVRLILSLGQSGV